MSERTSAGSGGLSRLLLGAVLVACAPAPAARGPAASTLAAREPPGPIQHVIVVTIDGLVPSAYLRPDEHGLAVPVLRTLAARGAISEGALSVLPSVTYPAHTSIASGVVPGKHGIVTNDVFDPLEHERQAYRWYAEDVRVPRVWDVAYAAGYRTALVDWPVTVGARATFLVPEVWRAQAPDELKLIRALSTPGLLDGVAEAFPTFRAGFRAREMTAEAGTDIAVYLIDTVRPHLLFLYLGQVDGAAHRHGLFGAEVRSAIETADRQLGRLIAATKENGLESSTAFVVASDHGFSAVNRAVHPLYLLKQAGLFTLGERGRPIDWEAWTQSASGLAYVYLKRPDDAELRARTLAVLEAGQREPGSGIARILPQAEIVRLGGDPAAFVALEAESGTTFGDGWDEYQSSTGLRAVHGYPSERPEMRASLLLYGSGVPRGRLVGARLIDVAPTVAAWLGLSLPGVDGGVLKIDAADP